MVTETQTESVALAAAKEQLMNISSELLDLSVMLERAKVAADSVLDYFGYRKEVHEENQGAYLLYHYDNARVFTGIVNEYVYDALQLTDKIMDSIDLNAERGNRNENKGY